MGNKLKDISQHSIGRLVFVIGLLFSIMIIEEMIFTLPGLFFLLSKLKTYFLFLIQLHKVSPREVAESLVSLVGIYREEIMCIYVFSCFCFGLIIPCSLLTNGTRVSVDLQLL